MKEIKAIIQPFMLSKVIDALKEIPAMPGVTVSEVKGFGRGRAEGVENSVTEWVTDALKAELVNLGYTISDQENITNVIDGTVFDVFCDTYMSLTYNGRIGIKVILKKNGIVALERNYSVNKTCDMLWSITSAQLAKTLEMTLQETLKQAVSDINKELLK